MASADDEGKKAVEEIKLEEQTAAGTRARKPTFVGAINTGDAFSRNMQGIIAFGPELRYCPEAAEALRTTNEFCDKYRALRVKVDVLQEDNNRLRKMLEGFLTLNKGPPPRE